MGENKIQIGGQAVIEGVMMRGPGHIACAVRRNDGSVDILRKDFVSLTKGHWFYKRPIIRGFVSLIEMLKIGIQSLNFSANRYELDYPDDPKGMETEEGEQKPDKMKKIQEVCTITLAMVLAFGFFAFLPNKLAELADIKDNDILFNLYGGVIRIIFFVLYVYLISLMKDVKRVFEYHGAEHKAVTAHENNEELSIENVKKFTTIHQRCGTSFMFLVLLISIIICSILDTFVAIIWERQTWLIRTLYQLPFLPLIAGIGYEIIKMSDKNSNNILVKLFTTPGMALQKITTQPPDDEQIEIAIIALKAALNDDLSEYKNIEFVEYPVMQENK